MDISAALLTPGNFKNYKFFLFALRKTIKTTPSIYCLRPIKSMLSKTKGKIWTERSPYQNRVNFEFYNLG
jgi:hypothetical protein